MNISSIGAALTQGAPPAHQAAQSPQNTAPSAGAPDGDHDGSATRPAPSGSGATAGLNLTA